MDIQEIGIIGYGYVGRAVHAGFNKPNNLIHISDPNYNEATIEYVVENQPYVVFVCVPTSDLKFKELNEVLDELERLEYKGIVVVKSTVLPEVVEHRDVVVNPEFLTQRTAVHDFINPPMLLLGGDRAKDVKRFYQNYSLLKTDKIFLTDKLTACMCKYMMNCFYATKLCYMNVMHEVANRVGANTKDIKKVIQSHPWMGTHHFDVPGPDGSRGFGGACLPKDMSMFAAHYDVELFHKILSINELHRNTPHDSITD